MQALGREPGGEGVEIVLGGSEVSADLVGGEPLVEAGRGRVLLVAEELVEGRLAFGRAAEDEGEMERLVVGEGELVGGSLAPAGEVVGELGAQFGIGDGRGRD